MRFIARFRVARLTLMLSNVSLKYASKTCPRNVVSYSTSVAIRLALNPDRIFKIEDRTVELSATRIDFHQLIVDCIVSFVSNTSPYCSLEDVVQVLCFCDPTGLLLLVSLPVVERHTIPLYKVEQLRTCVTRQFKWTNKGMRI